MRIRFKISNSWRFCLALLFVASRALAWDPTNGLILKGDVVTMDSQLHVVPDGRVVILGEKIVAVLKAGEPLPSSVSLPQALVIDTGGYIMPGLIDAHNHLEYNTLPLWRVPKRFSNRYQWSGVKAYDLDIMKPKTLLTDGRYMDQQTEAIKYAEVKAMLGGTTSIQGSPNLLSTRLLVRNIEHGNFGSDRIYTRTLSIADSRFQKDEAIALAQLMDAGKVDAWVVHLAEGTDTKSKDEFITLKKLKLLRDVTVIIHGTALQSGEFQELAHAGAKLVWSPLSNLLLYGKTTDIPTALEAGLTICLGVDWSPSGSKKLLGEIKIAHEYDKARWGHKLSDSELVKMVTVNPAMALGLDDKIGEIKVGYYADLSVFKKHRPDPYRNLIEAIERDVQLVIVGGVPCYGDLKFMKQLKGQGLETLTVQGTEKGLQAINPGVPSGNETFSECQTTLTKALLADRTYLHQHFGGGMNEAAFDRFLDKQLPGLHAVILDSLLPDKLFFNALRQSTNADLPFDVGSYWGQAEPESAMDAVLGLVNGQQTTLAFLDNDVGINSQAAKSIMNFRNGPDNNAGTADDQRFTTFAELDQQPYVGQSTLNLLRAYAASHQP
jgi:cytosine/adenosine deaminase-related metal-dependent hydrolase